MLPAVGRVPKDQADIPSPGALLPHPRPLEHADDWLRDYERLWDTRIERLTELLRHPDNEDPSDST